MMVMAFVMLNVSPIRPLGPSSTFRVANAFSLVGEPPIRVCIASPLAAAAGAATCTTCFGLVTPQMIPITTATPNNPTHTTEPMMMPYFLKNTTVGSSGGGAGGGTTSMFTVVLPLG